MGKWERGSFIPSYDDDDAIDDDDGRGPKKAR